MISTAASVPVDAILAQLRRKYPDWQRLDLPPVPPNLQRGLDPVCTKARTAWDRADLDRLYHAGAYAEILERFRKVGHRLLDRPGPSAHWGDFRILMEAADNPAPLCAALIDLVHGPDDGPARLQRHARVTQAAGLPCKWGFTTMCLSVADPVHNYLVKPWLFRSFLGVIGEPMKLSKVPDATTYRQVLALMHAVQQAMAQYGVRNLGDAHSIVQMVHDIAVGNRRGVRA